MRYYRVFSFFMMIIFAVVGCIFLFFTEGVLEFFNSIATRAGMELSPVSGANFYVILAVGYMYLVTVLSYMMVKHPDSPYFPLLLSNAKLASCVLSLSFFLLHQPYLIYIVNSIVDGSIGALALYFYLKIRDKA
ncbi:hypothetical protein JW998_04570 [candidate division KSB1 bacterium]|nr:hypothetical protein [candidate division KSB1 bacterium]